MIQLTATNNGPVIQLKLFSGTETVIHAAYLSTKENRVLSMYPALPYRLPQNTLSDLLVFTNARAFVGLNIVYTQRADATPKFAQCTVNLSGRFDPMKLRWKMQQLSFNPQWSYGFSQIDDCLLGLSGDVVICKNKVFTPQHVVFSPDLFHTYTELGALTTELETLKDMTAEKDLIGNLEMKISILQTKLKQMEIK